MDELRAHLMAFVARWNSRDKKPFRWTFAGYPKPPVATPAEHKEAA